MSGLFGWLRSLLSKFFKPKFKPKSTSRSYDPPLVEKSGYEHLKPRYPSPVRGTRKDETRTTIRSSDGGMRKLRRHRSGRLYDKRSGFDHNKKMVDIEDDDTRPRRKKRGWAEDRDKRQH